MTAYQCPFCNLSLALSNDTYSNYFLNFFDVTKFKNNAATWKRDNLTSVKVIFIKCPSCKKTSIYALGHSRDLLGLSVNIHPRTTYNRYPDYVPAHIKEDYQEAFAIIEFSERCAAMLARRCLKNMIEDFWQIENATLYDAIYSLREELDVQLWKAVESVCTLGNIGEHMKKDVNILIEADPLEAQRLIKLIELFIKEWYIARNNRDTMFDQIINMGIDIP